MTDKEDSGKVDYRCPRCGHMAKSHMSGLGGCATSMDSDYPYSGPMCSCDLTEAYVLRLVLAAHRVEGALGD